MPPPPLPGEARAGVGADRDPAVSLDDVLGRLLSFVVDDTPPTTRATAAGAPPAGAGAYDHAGAQVARPTRTHARSRLSPRHWETPSGVGNCARRVLPRTLPSRRRSGCRESHEHRGADRRQRQGEGWFSL